MYKKEIRIQQENLYKINLPATTKEMTQPHNCIVHTKYVHNNKNYFPPEPKKLAQHHNCMEL